jgi:hypothetical protein
MQGAKRSSFPESIRLPVHDEAKAGSDADYSPVGSPRRRLEATAGTMREECLYIAKEFLNWAKAKPETARENEACYEFAERINNYIVENN